MDKMRYTAWRIGMIVLLMAGFFAAGGIWWPPVAEQLGFGGYMQISREIEEIEGRLDHLESGLSQLAALEMELDRWADLLLGCDAIRFRTVSVSAMDWADGEPVLTVRFHDSQDEASIDAGSAGVYLQTELGLMEADVGALYDKFLQDQEGGLEDPYTLVFTDQRLRHIYQGDYGLR